MGIAKECSHESATDPDSQRLFKYQHLGELKCLTRAGISERVHLPGVGISLPLPVIKATLPADKLRATQGIEKMVETMMTLPSYPRLCSKTLDLDSE